MVGSPTDRVIRIYLYNMLTPDRRRMLAIAAIVVIMFCCTMSAILSLRAGRTAPAASTFFAGLAFSILFWTRLPKKADRTGPVPVDKIPPTPNRKPDLWTHQDV
jgi:fucose permease